MNHYFKIKGREIKSFVGFAYPKKEVETDKYEQITVEEDYWITDLSFGELFGWNKIKESQRTLKKRGIVTTKEYRRNKNDSSYDVWKKNEIIWCCLYHIKSTELPKIITKLSNYKIKRTFAGFFRKKEFIEEKHRIESALNKYLTQLHNYKIEVESLDGTEFQIDKLLPYGKLVNEIYDYVDFVISKIHANDLYDSKIIRVEFNNV